MDDEELTISGNWRVPISILISAIILTVGVCASFYSLKEGFNDRLMELNHDLKTGLERNLNAVSKATTVDQFQHWIEDARDANPSIKWPRLPPKDAAYGFLIPKDLLASKSAFRLEDLDL